MSEARERMEQLVRRLNETSYAYYVLDDPIISDMQWDQMYDELKKQDDDNPTIGIILCADTDEDIW